MAKRYVTIVLFLSLLFAFVAYIARQSAEREMREKFPPSGQGAEFTGGADETFARRGGRVYVTQPVTGEIREVDPPTARTLIDRHGWMASSLESARAHRARQIVDEAVRQQITPSRSWWFGVLDGASLGTMRLAMPNALFDVSSEMFPGYSWLGRAMGFGLVVAAIGRLFRGSPKAAKRAG